MSAVAVARKLPEATARAALVLAMAAAVTAGAEEQGNASNTGTLSAVARLDFEVNIYKYVMLRVGAAGALVPRVDFRVGLTPDLGAGNAQAYAGAIPGLTTRVTTTNPASGGGSLAVEMFSNATSTRLTCSLSALAGATAFAAGGTTPGGVPGRSNILVSASGVGHPGPNIASCDGTTNAAVAALSNLNGTFTYSTNFTPASLAPGTYGNVVTYTLTAP